jgi:hypothetical protein
MFMGFIVNLRIKPLVAEIPVLQTEFEVMVAEHNSLSE